MGRLCIQEKYILTCRAGGCWPCSLISTNLKPDCWKLTCECVQTYGWKLKALITYWKYEVFLCNYILASRWNWCNYTHIFVTNFNMQNSHNIFNRTEMEKRNQYTIWSYIHEPQNLFFLLTLNIRMNACFPIYLFELVLEYLCIILWL